MATARAIRAGQAFIELFVENSKLVRGLRAAENKVRAFGNFVNSVGKQMTKLGIAAAAPGALAVRTFAKFDDQMRAVKAVTEATGDDFDMLTEKAKLLGRTTSFSASEVAAGMVELGKAGFSATDIDIATEAMLNLSRASGTDLTTAMSIVGATLGQFGLKAEDAADVADMLTAAANASQSDVTGLGEALANSGTLAAEYGMSLSDMLKNLGALSNVSIKRSKAGNDLKRVMSRLVDPAVQKEFQKLGVTLDVGGKMRNLADIMRDVGKALEDASPKDKLAAYNNLFGLNAIATGAKLTTAEFGGLADAIDNYEGVAKRTAKEMDAGIGGSMRSMWSAIEGVSIAIGEALAPALQDIMGKVNTAIGGVAKYISENKELIVTVAKIAAVAIAAGVGLVAASLAIAGIANLIGIVATAISALGGIAMIGFNAVVGIATTIGAVASVTVSALGLIGAAIFGVLGLVGTIIGIILSPIGAVIAAVVAIGAVVISFLNTTGKVSAAVKNTFSQATGVVGNATKQIKGFFANAFDAIVEAFGWLKEQFARLANFAMKTFDAIATALGRGDIETVIQVVWASIKLVWIEGTNWILNTWDWLVKTLQNVWTGCVYNVAETLANAWYDIQEVWAEAVFRMELFWEVFISGVVNKWKAAEKAIAHGIGYLIARMQGLDPAEMTKTIDADYNQKEGKRKSEQKSRLLEISSERKEKLNQINDNRSGVTGILGDDRDRIMGGREAAAQAKRDERQKKADEAKAAYDAAIARAKAPAEVIGDESESMVAKAKRKLDEVLTGFSRMSPELGKRSTASAVNSFSMLGLKSGGPFDAIKTNTKKTSDILAEMNRKMAQIKPGDIPDKTKNGEAGTKPEPKKEDRQLSKTLGDLPRKIATEISKAFSYE